MSARRALRWAAVAFAVLGLAAALARAEGALVLVAASILTGAVADFLGRGDT
jgi:hypothetical protein